MKNLKGYFRVEQIRDCKVIRKYKFRNTITKEGKTHGLNSIFGLVAQITSWYIGLISSTSFIRVLSTDTQAVHVGWIENTHYNEVTRQLFTPILATNCDLESGAATVFTMNVSETIKGLIITSGSVKGGTSGVLWAAALQNMDAIAGDQLRVSYKVEA